MPRQLDEIWIEVQARTESAKKKLDDLAKTFEKTEKSIQDNLKKLNEKANVRKSFDKADKEQKKRLREELKANGQTLSSVKTLLKLREQLAKQVKDYQKTLTESKKDIDLRAADKQVTQAKQLEHYVKQTAARQQDYYEFLKRAGMENARFADRLDKRDRTRSLIENMRRGMDKGAAISMRFHAEENAVYRLERSIGIASTAFDRARHPSEALTDAFYRFQRISYAIQSALGVLAGTIGDLVGGMMALVGVATAAAGSLAAVAGAFANLAAGMVTAKFALSGVGAAVQQLWEGQTDYNRALADAKKRFRDLRFEAEEAALSEQEAAIALEKARENLARVQDLPADNRARREAELEFQRAELNYRRAKARTKDTNDELKRGPKSTAGQNPFNNLTKSQIAFAKYLASLKPVVQSLKEAAASSFLPPLQKSIQVMVDNLVPALKDGLNSVGEALGDASRNFTDAFKDKGNIKLFREFLENSKPTIRILGAVANKAFGGILVVLKAAQPITDRFVRWVYTVAAGFEEWAKSGGEDKLRKFFKLAGDVASNLGEAFKLVFGGLKNIIAATFPNGANSGAGGIILQWLKELGAGFKLFTGSNEFANWLKGATDNAKTALATLGDFLKIFLDLAASPDNKVFWNTLRDAVPFVRKILEDGQKAGPAFANLIVAITRFISLLSETGALQSFFNTLALIVNTAAAALKVFKPFLDLIGQIHGVFLALALAGVLLRKVVQIFLGVMMKLTRVAGAATAGFLNLRGMFRAISQEGNTFGQRIRNGVQQLIALNREARNTKRIEFLGELAKTDKQKQIAALRARIAGLKAEGKGTTKAVKELEGQIEELNNAYKRLKDNLRSGAKDAKTFTQLLDQQKVKADAATFSLDKYAKVQDRMRLAGRIARGVGMTGVGIASGIQAAQSASVQGGAGSALMMAGGIASFFPGGAIAGLGLSIVGSIVDGFDRANKEAEQAKEQKRIEIKARLAEITAEKVEDTKSTIGAFMGRGDDILRAGKRAEALEAQAQTVATNLGLSNDKVNVNKLIASITGSTVLGDQAYKTGGTQPLTQAVLKLIQTGSFTQDQAVAEIEKIFTGFQGKTGLSAITAYLESSGVGKYKVNQNAIGDTTVEALPQLTPAQKAKEAQRAALKNLRIPGNPLLGQGSVLVSQISQARIAGDQKTLATKQKELAGVIQQIIELNKKYGPIAEKTLPLSSLLRGTLNMPYERAYRPPGMTTSEVKGYTTTSLLDPKTKIYYDTTAEQTALTNDYLFELVDLVKKNPTKTSITLKDKNGKVIGTYEIDRAVGSGGIG